MVVAITTIPALLLDLIPSLLQPVLAPAHNFPHPTRNPVGTASEQASTGVVTDSQQHVHPFHQH